MRRAFWRRWALGILGTSVAAATAAVALNLLAPTRGERLFDGTDPLVGTLADHATPLAAGAARCTQCHAGPRRDTAVPTFGPTLDRQHLREAWSRRGGPPVAYDLASFCRVMRIGIDPAHVVLPRSMPRFDIDDERCEALWQHLTREHT